MDVLDLGLSPGSFRVTEKFRSPPAVKPQQGPKKLGQGSRAHSGAQVDLRRHYDAIIPGRGDRKASLSRFLNEMIKKNGLEDEFGRIPIPIPDAWLWIPNPEWERFFFPGSLVIFEVEKGARMDRTRVLSYSDLWFEFDCEEECMIYLVIVDAFKSCMWQADLVGGFYNGIYDQDVFGEEVRRQARADYEQVEKSFPYLGKIGDPFSLSSPYRGGKDLLVTPK